MTKMTDEEMAEEYVKENTPLFNALGKEMTYTYKYMKQAFLAGLKIGEKPKWHEVVDVDLPEESVPIFVLSSDGSINRCIYIPNAGFKDVDFSNWYNPVAWIEEEKLLPKR